MDMGSKIRLAGGLFLGLVGWYAAVIAADYLLVHGLRLDENPQSPVTEF